MVNYKVLRKKVNTHSKAFEIYRKKTGRNWINDEEAKKYNVPKDISNEQKSKLEVYEYKQKPLKKGEKYFAYLSNEGDKVQTWVGDDLGKVYNLKETKSRGYEKNYSFDVIDINGNKLKGRAYAGKGGYVRLRRVD